MPWPLTENYINFSLEVYFLCTRPHSKHVFIRNLPLTSLISCHSHSIYSLVKIIFNYFEDLVFVVCLFFYVKFKSSSEICFIFVIGFQLWKKPKLVSPCEWKRERELSYATWAYGRWVKIMQRGRTCKNKHYVFSSNPRNSGAVFNLESDQLNVRNHKIAIGIMKLSSKKFLLFVTWKEECVVLK